MEIVRRDIFVRDTGNLPHALGQFHLATWRQYRPAIPHEKLREHGEGNHANECSHHCVFTTNSDGANRESSGTLVIV